MVSTWRTKLREEDQSKRERHFRSFLLMSHGWIDSMVSWLFHSSRRAARRRPAHTPTHTHTTYTRTCLRLTLKGPKWNQLKYPRSSKRFKWLKEANKQKRKRERRPLGPFFIPRHNSSRTQGKHRVCVCVFIAVSLCLESWTNSRPVHTGKEIASTKWSWLVSGQPKPVSRLVILSLLVCALFVHFGHEHKQKHTNAHRG